MTSAIDPNLIDPTKPVQGTPTTLSVRTNFAGDKTNWTAAKAEISALQAGGFPGITGAGIVAITVANTTAVTRSLAQPAAGITIANQDGVAGNPTFALANDLAALEGLSSTGIAVRTGTDTWAQRTITGTANQIIVTNGDGVGGVPTLSLPSAVSLPGSMSTVGAATVGGALSVTGAAQFAASLSYPGVLLATFGPASNQSGVVQINDIGAAGGTIFVDAFTASAGGPAVTFHKSRGASPGINTAVQSADQLGVVVFRGADGTNYPNCATISALVNGSVSTGRVPTELLFKTSTALGALNNAAVMDDNQNFGLLNGTVTAATFGGGVGAVMFVAEAVTIPSASPTTGFLLYVNPTDHKLYARGASGTVTALALP